MVDYAYHAATTCDVRIQHTPNSFAVELIDVGIPFDPSAVLPPDINAPFEERRTEGLSVLLPRKMVDELRYTRESDRNHLMLVMHK